MCPRLLPAPAALIALAAAGFAPVPPPKPAKGQALDLKALQGSWAVVRYETGRAKGALTTTYSRVVIKGQTWTQMRATKAKESPGPSYTFTLDTKKSPPWIDMTMDAAKGTTSGARRGVLELKGDELIVTYGMVSKDVPRPDKPGAKITGLQYRWVLKREKP